MRKFVVVEPDFAAVRSLLMSRSIGLALLLSISASTVGSIAAQASTITYDLTLAATSGPLSGTGSFSVTGPISPIFQNFTASTGLLSLNFAIGGHDFSLANSLGGTNVTFLGGNISSILYFGKIVDLGQSLSLSISSAGLKYAYVDLFNLGNSSVGNISASVAPSPVPGPIAGVGLPGLVLATLSLGLLAWRRRERRQ
jgi:hypothetical protein